MLRYFLYSIIGVLNFQLLYRTLKSYFLYAKISFILGIFYFLLLYRTRKNPKIISYMLNNNFSYIQLSFFFFFRKILIQITMILALFFFFFFRKILVPFTCFFSKLFFAFSDIYLPFLYIYIQKNLQKYFYQFFYIEKNIKNFFISFSIQNKNI